LNDLTHLFTLELNAAAVSAVLLDKLHGDEERAEEGENCSEAGVEVVALGDAESGEAVRGDAADVLPLLVAGDGSVLCQGICKFSL